MRKYLKSPFILATLGGTAALIADAIWLVGELITHFGIITVKAYVIYRIVILAALIISIIFCVKGILNYVQNGYKRAEDHGLHLYKCHKRAKQQLKVHVKRIHHEDIE